jgi:hypothetical protein
MAESPSPPAAPGTGLEYAGGPVEEDDEDWFGAGSSFDSGEDLAAALFAMAGTAPQAGEEAPTPPPTPVATTPALLTVDTSGFRVVETSLTITEPERRSWAVREAALGEGADARQWGIRHSVQILKRTEQVMARLQRDAVEVTFRAASMAVAQSLPPRETTNPNTHVKAA